MALTDEAIEKIRAMITSGELRPGDRLPSEPELGAQLGLSRSSLREAVKALSLINVLDVRRGDGTYVTSLDPGLLLDAMSFAVDFQHDRSVLHFLEVRRILEPAAMALSATAMSDDEIASLGALLEECRPSRASRSSSTTTSNSIGALPGVPATPFWPRSSTACPAVPSAPGSGAESPRRRRFTRRSTNIARSSPLWPAGAPRSRTPARWCTSPVSSSGCATPLAAAREDAPD